MTETDFFPYHNKHIKFKHKNGTELTGVLFDSLNMSNRTIYTFVATKNMIAWKKAEQDKDLVAMKSLEGQFDVNDIDSAELLNY